MNIFLNLILLFSKFIKKDEAQLILDLKKELGFKDNILKKKLIIY